MLQSSGKPPVTARGVHGVACLVPARYCARARRNLRCCNAQPAGFGPAVPFSGMHPLGLQYFLYYAILSTLSMQCGAGGSTSTHVLPHKPNLQGKDVRANWNAVALAFLGDSVWEVCLSENTGYALAIVVCVMPDYLHMQLYARRRFFSPPKRTSQYYDKVIAEVRAETQVPSATYTASSGLTSMHCIVSSEKVVACCAVWGMP